MKMLEKPCFQNDKSVSENVEALYEGICAMVETMNRERATSARNVVYSGTVASGTATVSTDTSGHVLFVAVIGGVPTLAVLSDGVLAARGGNKDSEASLTGTVLGAQLTFSASAPLQKLIVII